MNTASPRATGGCLCGAVRYEIHGPLRDVVNCHCGQCRRSHGHVAAYSSVTAQDLVLREAGALTWFQSSERARRGFCGTCGSRLFWEPLGQGRMAVAAGSFDQPSGLETIGHIFTAEAGDYYEITDGLEQRPDGFG